MVYRELGLFSKQIVKPKRLMLSKVKHKRSISTDRISRLHFWCLKSDPSYQTYQKNWIAIEIHQENVYILPNNNGL